MSKLLKPSDFCVKITDSLISYWEFHRGFDANIKDLAKFSQVSRDTVYRWLNRRAYPREEKAVLIDSWLKKRE